MFALFSVSAQLAFIALWCFVIAVAALEIYCYRHDHLETLRHIRGVMRAWLGPVRWPRLRVTVRIPKRTARAQYACPKILWLNPRDRRDELAKIAAPREYRKAVSRG